MQTQRRCDVPGTEVMNTSANQFNAAKRLLQSHASEMTLRVVTEDCTDGWQLGDAFVDFDGTDVRLRLLLDRDQTYVEIAPLFELDKRGHSSHWYPPTGLLEFIGALESKPTEDLPDV